jgi:hypothetical protein
MIMPQEPYSLSVAPPPRATEYTLIGLEVLTQGTEFSSVDELNAYLGSEEGQRALKNPAPTESHLQALGLCLTAWGMDPPDRYLWARRALDIDDRMGDALLILAEEETAWRKRVRLFEDAASRLSRLLTDLDLWSRAKDSGSLWHHVTGRPWIRARIAWARELVAGGRLDDAVRLYEETMAWDGEDHAGLRHDLVPLYHELGRIDALDRLSERFTDAADTVTAWERVWLAWRRDPTDADVAQLRQAFDAAWKVNSHVPGAFLRMDEAANLGPTMEIGGPDEALYYAMLSLRWWLDPPERFRWLLRVQDAKAFVDPRS